MSDENLKQFAQDQAKVLGEKTLRVIGKVLAKHDAGIIEGAIAECEARDAQIATLSRSLDEALAKVRELSDQLELAEAKRSDEAFSGALSDELMKSERDELLTALREACSMLRHFRDGGDFQVGEIRVVVDQCDAALSRHSRKGS